MQGFTVLIDREQKEELYSDIAQEFLNFFLMEAVVLLVSDPSKMKVLDDPTLYCDDPESQFENAVIWLLETWSASDQESGVLMPGEFYEYNSEHHEMVCMKLNQAVAAIQDVNDPLSMLMIQRMLEDPAYSKAITFSAMHLPDRVVFLIQPQPFGFGAL